MSDEKEVHVGVDMAALPDVTVKEMWKRCPSCNSPAHARWDVPQTFVERTACLCGKTNIPLSITKDA